MDALETHTPAGVLHLRALSAVSLKECLAYQLPDLAARNQLYVRASLTEISEEI